MPRRRRPPGTGRRLRRFSVGKTNENFRIFFCPWENNSPVRCPQTARLLNKRIREESIVNQQKQNKQNQQEQDKQNQQNQNKQNQQGQNKQNQQNQQNRLDENNLF